MKTDGIAACTGSNGFTARFNYNGSSRQPWIFRRAFPLIVAKKTQFKDSRHSVLGFPF